MFLDKKIFKITFLNNSSIYFQMTSRANFLANREFAFASRRIEIRCKSWMIGEKHTLIVSKWKYASARSLSGDRFGKQRIDSQRQFATISVAMQRDGANGRRAVIVLQLLSYLIAASG